MATTSSSESRKSSRGGSRGGASTLRKSVTNAVSSDTLLDIVQRLGLMDMVIDRVRGRIQEVDIDELLDDVGRYLKRNPEVIVVALGTITIAAGALVYLERRDRDYSRLFEFEEEIFAGDDDEEDDRPASRPASRSKSSGAARKKS